MTDVVTVSAQQDALRPLRQFVGALTGAVSGYDQATVYSDWYSYNMPTGYQAVGPYSVSAEGQPYALPITATRNGSLVISPTLMLFAAGVAVALLWKK